MLHSREFPYLVITSKVLDLLDQHECSLVVEHFLAVQHIASQALQISRTPDNTLKELQINDGDLYHFKSLSAFFAVYGENLPAFNASLVRFGRMLECLYSCSLADSLCFPITIFHPATLKERGCFVFPKLSDYRIGLPSDRKVASKIVAEARAVMEAVHRECGVVHMDLYLSNIMWKVDKEKVSVKIIDWDAAHRIGKIFTPRVSVRIRNFGAARLKFVDPTKATTACDTFYLDALDFALQDEELFGSLQSEDKPALDASFAVLCDDYVISQKFVEKMKAMSLSDASERAD